MSKIKRFFRQTGLTKAQLISSLLCYFLCFALFLGIVVIWNPLSLSSTPTEDSQAADGPTNTSGYWTDTGRYDTTWYTSGDTATYGDGTESNPYKISTAAQLAGLSYLVYNNAVESSDVTTSDDENYIFQDRYFKQTLDIDLSAYYWQPIGIRYTREKISRYNYFSGNYDGDGHTVSGVFTPAGSSYEYSYQGLFGNVRSSSSSSRTTIQNIGITNSFIQGDEYIGGVVGYARASSGTITITNCYNTGDVTGGSSAGGVVGYAYTSSGSITITNCYNTGSVESTGRYVGGVVGEASGATVTNCYNTGNISSTYDSVFPCVGGVVGYASGSTTVTNCYNTGTVSGSANVGGVVGEAPRATITNCYNTGTVTGSSRIVGGVVGAAGTNTTITNCYNIGNVTSTATGLSYVGGVVGNASSSATVTNCYNTGSVRGSGDYVGGVVGDAGSNTTITNCYNTGSVSGSSNIGGVVGRATSNVSITNCYYGGGVTETPGSYGTYLSDIEDSAKTLPWYTNSSNWNPGDSWDFENVWTLDQGRNDGYPSFIIDYWISDPSYYSLDWYNNAAEGVGDSESNPYIIDSAADLAGLSYLVYENGRSFQSKYFKQTANIDLSAYYWQPIGIYYDRDGTEVSHYFSGNYDGGGHTVSGVFTPAGSGNGYSYQGLFGYIESGNPIVIKNVGVVNSHIQGNQYVGGVVGRVILGSSLPKRTDNISIKNCYNEGIVQGSGFATGGIVGDVLLVRGSFTLEECFNEGNIKNIVAEKSESSAGGIIGKIEASGYLSETTCVVKNCYNNGTVEATGNNCGGILGYEYQYQTSKNPVTIANCYNTGSVTGYDYVGGVVGRAYLDSGNITVVNCFNVGSVSSNYIYEAAILGCVYLGFLGGSVSVDSCYYGGKCPSTVSGLYYENNPVESDITYLNDITTNAKTISWYTAESNWNSSYPWDFDYTWVLDASENDGYPNLTGYWTHEGRYSIDWYRNAGANVGSTADNPYIIDSAADLAGLSWLVYTKGQEGNPLIEGTDYSGSYIFQGKHFKQTANIDLSAYYWQPIGIRYTREGTSRRNHFSGSYDGGNHTVSGVFTPAGSSDAYSDQGLFGYVCSSSSSSRITIQNVGVINSHIQGYQYVGGIAGEAGINTTITNCYNSGSVTGSSVNVGGVVGYADTYSGTFTITNCYNTGSVESTGSYVGGVVGYADSNTTITNCYNTGSVSGSSSVGGVVGYAYTYSGTITITNCYNTGSVSGSSDYVGGVVGDTYASSSGTITITNCYNTGSVESTGSYVGGVVGYAYASSSGTITITNCYNTGDVTGSRESVGGVVGRASSSATITNCYYGGGVTETPGSYGTYLSNLVNLAKTETWYSPFSGNWQTGEDVAWDFFTVWKIDANLNNGYPSFREESEIVGFWTDHVTVTSYGGGNGTQSSPYQISNAQQLALLAKNVNSGTDYSGTYFKQTADINLSGYLWDPIGRDYDRYGTESLNRFAGNYDGAGFKVTGISTSNLLSHQGLFGSATGSITRVNISESNINGYQYVGGVVGGASGTISNCYNVGAVTGSRYVGGVVGYAGPNTTIESCYNIGAVSGTSPVGGVVGCAYASSGSITITNCYNAGEVTGISDVGGVVGYASDAITITNCFNTGSVSGNGAVGGVVGYARASSSGTITTITNCYNTGTVTGPGSEVGGVVGYAYAYSSGTITITNCFNTGSVSGSSSVGGVVGYVYASSTTGCNISKSANFGDITVTGSSGRVGGIVGYVRVTNSSYSFKMTNCYSEGSIIVSGTRVTVGGFVGNLYADYSTYSNVKIEFCSVDLDIVVSGGSIASQGAFYGGTNGLTVENSYSLLTSGGAVNKVISAVQTNMDNNFGYMLNFKEGRPIPLGVFHILDFGTTTGIADRVKAL